MSKFFTFMIFLYTLVYSNNLDEVNSIRDEIISSENHQENKSNFFITFGYGQAKTSLTTNLSSVHATSGAFNKTGEIADLAIGYYFNKNLYSTIAYQYSALDLLYLDNFYTSLNYQFSDTLFQPSFGLIVGASRISWKNSPVKNTLSSNLNEIKTLFGCQSSFYNRLTSNNFIFLKYQYMYMNHNLTINNNAAYLKHKDENNIIIGVKHEFK